MYSLINNTLRSPYQHNEGYDSWARALEGALTKMGSKQKRAEEQGWRDVRFSTVRFDNADNDFMKKRVDIVGEPVVFSDRGPMSTAIGLDGAVEGGSDLTGLTLIKEAGKTRSAKISSMSFYGRGEAEIMYAPNVKFEKRESYKKDSDGNYVNQKTGRIDPEVTEWVKNTIGGMYEQKIIKFTAKLADPDIAGDSEVKEKYQRKIEQLRMGTPKNILFIQELEEE